MVEDWALRVEDLVKVYDGATRANDGVSLVVQPGEVFGLLGPNGAGKSTLVKQLIGLLKPTSGRIDLGSYDLVTNPGAARRLCSYLPQAQLPIDSFRVEEAIRLTGTIRGGPPDEVRRRAAALIDALDLGEWRNALGVRLSGGVKRLVGFAMVSVWPGRVVILDEPTNDVDPHRRRLLWELVRELGKAGTAVVLVTHNVSEAERAVDRVAVFEGGRVVADGTPSSLKSGDRGRLRLQVMLVPGVDTPEVPRFARLETRVGHNVLASVDETDAAAAIRWAQQLMVAHVAEEYALAATSLEDVYIRLTGHLSEQAAGTTVGDG
jgi:ABC-2 type transport system ATP-binding protein